MFLGTFTPRLLPQYQLALPAKLRAELKGKKAVIAKGFDRCIYGFSPEDWQKIAEAELLKPLLTEEGRRMRQTVFSQAEEITLDSQGRFVVPAYLREYAGIELDMVVIGAGDHFEIWEKSQWEKLSENLKISE